MVNKIYSVDWFNRKDSDYIYNPSSKCKGDKANNERDQTAYEQQCGKMSDGREENKTLQELRSVFCGRQKQCGVL